MKWFKFYGADFLSDPKTLSLSASERSCWLTLLCYGSVNDNGVITFLSEEQLMQQAGICVTSDEWDRTIGVLEKLKKLGMIENDNEVITLINWKKRQETNLTSYERVKRYREKKQNDNAKITLEENRIDKKRIEEKEDTHSKYGEFKNVLLTSEEYEKLCSVLGVPNADSLIAELSSYLASSGKRYRSHYATLQNWARRKVQEHKNKPTKGKQII